MPKPFFPNPEFAWGFLALLASLLALASYVDFRRTVVPKWLTLPLLGAGVVASIARGAWLGVAGQQSGFFTTDSLWLGGLDGLLYALIGVVCSFAMIFLLWILGTCGGGDVKLFAAVGAWTGWLYAVFILAASLVVLFVIVLVKVVTLGASPTAVRRLMRENRKGLQKQQPKVGKWRITYSFPVTVATVVVFLWFCRDDLRIAPNPAGNPRAQAHAR
jgi:prepilin peptidase CpaA